MDCSGGVVLSYVLNGIGFQNCCVLPPGKRDPRELIAWIVEGAAGSVSGALKAPLSTCRVGRRRLVQRDKRVGQIDPRRSATRRRPGQNSCPQDRRNRARFSFFMREPSMVTVRSLVSRARPLMRQDCNLLSCL